MTFDMEICSLLFRVLYIVLVMERGQGNDGVRARGRYNQDGVLLVYLF